MRWVQKLVEPLAEARTRVRGLLGPFWSGFLTGFGSCVVIAVGFGFSSVGVSLPNPTPELFDHLAQVGAALLIGYAVTLAAVGPGGFSHSEHVHWLAYGCGIAIAGLIAVGICLALSTSDSAGVSKDLHLFALSWAASAIALLGGVVCIGPLLIYQNSDDG